VQKTSFFVTSGLLISYYIDMDGKEHLIQIAPEGWWISDLNSFTRQKGALLNIRAVEESTVIELPFLQTDNMFDQIPQMDKYFRVITERALINFQKRMIENNSMTARDRMLQFREHYPDLVNRLPQKLIASYLGISPEFLSKIKKETFAGTRSGSEQ
jgi:CRP-like cAMP-binding protein